jgi:hypothetical protein
MPAEVAHWTVWWAGTAGVIVGSLIPIGLAWWSRRTERLGELDGMLADLYQAERCMRALRTDDPPVPAQSAPTAPLLRLPLRMFDIALPKLIGEGLLSQNGVATLLEYVMRAEELNRGLDRASDARAQGRYQLVEEEYKGILQIVARIIDVTEERLSGLSLRNSAWDALLHVEERHRLHILRLRIAKTWGVVRPRLAAFLRNDSEPA